jgi:hypothetical protein
VFTGAAAASFELRVIITLTRNHSTCMHCPIHLEVWEIKKNEKFYTTECVGKIYAKISLL